MEAARIEPAMSQELLVSAVFGLATVLAADAVMDGSEDEVLELPELLSPTVV